MGGPALNILFVGPEITSPAEIRTYGAVWSYYLSRELRQRGVGVRFVGQLRADDDNAPEHYRHLDLAGIDHVVSLGVRYFDRLPSACGTILMERMASRGAVAQIHDGAVLRAPVDFTFTVRDDSGRYPPGSPQHDEFLAKTRYIGWAADPRICWPGQPDDELRILVDHPLYGDRTDATRAVLTDLHAFVHHGRWRKDWSAVRVRQILDGDIADIDLFDPKVAPYKRMHIPYADICREYSETHIFMPTHQEGVGLSALETAMAGALVVAREGFIAPDRLKTIRHLVYKDVAPWGVVVDSIDVRASRTKAVENSWAAVAKRMIEHLKGFKK